MLHKIDALMEYIAPHRCFRCGAIGAVLCGVCAEGELGRIRSTCYRCNKLTIKFRTCKSCRFAAPIYSVYAFCEYNKVARELIAQIKFQNRRAGCKVVASCMELFDLPQLDAIIPLPTATSRVRLRGFDHTKLIAQYLAKNSKTPVVQSLIRRGQSRQVGSSRWQRSQNMRSAFACRTNLAGRTVLLVDDVISSGASMQSAARVLKESGAKRVYAVVFARNLY